MGRVFLTIIVPLLLPSALFLGWRLAAGRGLNLPAAWIWLLVIGLLLASLTLVAVNVDFGGAHPGVYVPPHVSNGLVVPGHVQPAPVTPAPPPN